MSQEYTLNLKLSCEPRVAVRVVLPSDNKATIKSKMKNQFINKKTCILTVDTGDRQFTITAYKDFCFDSATIPFGIGKGDTRLFVPALYHDLCCTHKELVNYDYKLATEIFRELLLMNNVPKWKANTMAFFVNQYQRFMRGWKN